MTKYSECLIKACHSGFGLYAQNNNDTGDAWDDRGDLINAIRDNFGSELVLLSDNADLPDGIEDIRGRIHNEAGDIYGWLDDRGDAHYFAIREDEDGEQV